MTENNFELKKYTEAGWKIAALPNGQQPNEAAV
jgi:hypothetical protein